MQIGKRADKLMSIVDEFFVEDVFSRVESISGVKLSEKEKHDIRWQLGLTLCATVKVTLFKD